MEEEKQTFVLDRIKKRLELFFPDTAYSTEIVRSGVESGDFFSKSSKFLPFLQTALFDEKIVEVEINGLTRVYFGRIIDDLPDLVEEEVDGESVLTEPDYTPGDYLKRMTHIISLPIEPGIGNLYIRYSKKIILRIFTSTYAVEFGTLFDELTSVRGLPVLRLAFPSIGRIVRGAREFRAKVPQKMELELTVAGKRKQPPLKTRITDISASGMSFSLEKHEQTLFQIDEVRSFDISLDGEFIVTIKGNIRHMSKIRKKQSIEYICGAQFDLATRALAAKIESLVATVQRAHLKEISDISDESGIDLIA